MNQKRRMSILEFSKLTGIKRENLRFYDRIGLLSPETRGENNYRYYSRQQLNTAYLVTALRGIGVGIEDIKAYAVQHSPQKSLALFAQQDARIQAEIERLQEARLIMKMYTDMVTEALAHGENALFLEEHTATPIFLCPPIPAHMDDDQGGVFSYEQAEASGVNLGFPQGTKIAWKDICAGNISAVGRYYFKVGKGENTCKPAGLYAVAYGRCDPWHADDVYNRLLCFIEQQGLCACGDAYEEYPLGELAELEFNLIRIRVEIPVVRK